MDSFTYKSTHQNTQMTSNRVKGNQSYYKRTAQEMLKQWEKTLRELQTNNFHQEFSHLSFCLYLITTIQSGNGTEEWDTSAFRA
jgi:uncharacterized protein RhaS with RHS repeats